MRTLTLSLMCLASTASAAPSTSAPADVFPEGGVLVSYRSLEHLVVARVTKTAVKELLRYEQVVTTADVYWLDAKTLAVLEVDDNNEKLEVRYIVDGVLDPKRTTTFETSAWELKKNEEPRSALLRRTADGAVWIERCLREVDTDNGPTCKLTAWLRADKGPAKATRKKPGKLVSREATLPTVKAPAGYAAKIVKIKSELGNGKIGAVECTSPTGKTTWSENSMVDSGEQFAPKKVRWVSAAPAIFAVDGKHTNPVGWAWPDTFYFRACPDRELGELELLGGGVWVERPFNGEHLLVYAGDRQIAKLAGEWLVSAPR